MLLSMLFRNVLQVFFKNLFAQKHDFWEAQLHVDNMGTEGKAPKNKAVLAVDPRIAGHQWTPVEP